MLKRLVAAALVTLLPVGVSAQVVEYYHLDLIGNVRAVTNQATVVVERHDYQPFGEEWNPQPGAQPKRFTGKERDAETGLDYFGARYYGSKIGRFTTIDPVMDRGIALADPQQWNRYAYGRNNALRYVDPDGRQVAEAIRGAGQAVQGIGHPTAVRIGGALIILAANVDKIPTIIDAVADSGVFAHAQPGYPGMDIAMDRAMVGVVSGDRELLPLTFRKKEGTGPKADEAPGVTAGGQATDRHGNKLGPSGKIMINDTDNNTREGAKNKSLSEGTGAVEHRNPKRGGPHFHPTGADGRKKQGSTHHNFPE